MPANLTPYGRVSRMEALSAFADEARKKVGITPNPHYAASGGRGAAWKDIELARKARALRG